MKVRWSSSALSSLTSIYAYLARRSPQYALVMVDRLTRKTLQLEQFPISGKVNRELNNIQIRELIEGPYRIFYHLKPDAIEILNVIHGSQQFPPPTEEN